ncbi:MAG: magnesium transporter [Clostridiales bacterium]|nr:magnesium transporter [Clostridiales bacterium]
MNASFDTLLTLVKEKRFHALINALDSMNAVDIAEFLDTLDNTQLLLVFRTLKKDISAEIFSELSQESKSHIVNMATDTELAHIIEELYVDDAVDMLEEMPASIVKRCLKAANPETRALLNQFLKYPEDSAGSIMTAEFIDLRKTMTVEQAIAHIRETGLDKETVYVCYVIDATRKLEGVVTFRDLLFARPDQPLKEIMNTDVIFSGTFDDREETVRKLTRYNFLALPIVDAERRLVGIVTFDDAIDVIEEEATEDFSKMAAITPLSESYMKTGILSLAKSRALWLLLLMISSMITSVILEKYEAAFSAVPLLVSFIPMITGTGGNAGSQSSTMAIRGIALREIALKDWYKVLFKETSISLIVGSTLCIVNFVRLLIMYPGQLGVTIVVTLTMLGTVLIANAIGGILPILAKALGADPAIMAAPLITTFVDALSLLIYFSIASAIL